jgi:sugar phosphate isomerase/epimerase
MSLVVVAASAYGAELVHRHGHAYLLPIVAAAGAAGIEIRRELFVGEQDLNLLREQIAAHELFAVYSAPVELWEPDGMLAQAALAQAMEEAALVQARALKVSLGHFSAACDLAALAQFVDRAPLPLLLENDQTPQGGKADPIQAFLQACGEHGVRIGMTFDIGNWRWQQGDPEQAAAALGSYVQYVHCKGVVDDAGKLKAVPLSASDAPWQALFRHFAPGVQRAIEFPLVGDDLIAVTRHYVNLLDSVGME